MICRLRRGENRTNRKVFGQAFFKKLAGDKRGRRPLLCSAARGAVRNAKQKKAVPAKNSEAIFWRPRFTWPLRAGKRANANFACSEGFFCARRAAPFARAGRFFEACRCLACWLLRPVFRREFPAAALAAVRALCRRWACVLWLCSRSEGLTFCRFCCGFCAWPALLPVAFVLRLRCWGLLAVCAAFRSCFFPFPA